MFQRVRTAEPSSCKNRPDTLKLMRKVSHSVLSTKTLESYLGYLSETVVGGRNLLTERHARMDDLMSCLNTDPVVDKIVEAEGCCRKELSDRYPLTFRRQSDHVAGVYLRSELETYSPQMLELYFEDVSKAIGRDLAAERYSFLFQHIGYSCT
jgi:hypothetical protein